MPEADNQIIFVKDATRNVTHLLLNWDTQVKRSDDIGADTALADSPPDSAESKMAFASSSWLPQPAERLP